VTRTGTKRMRLWGVPALGGEARRTISAKQGCWWKGGKEKTTFTYVHVINFVGGGSIKKPARKRGRYTDVRGKNCRKK